MPGTFEEKASNIQCPINLAIDYIARNGVPADNHGVYYLKREEGNPHRYKPDGWATLHQSTGRWVGIKEVIRVAYLFAIKETPHPLFDDDDLNRIGPPSPREENDDSLRWTTDQAKEILERCKFSCKQKALPDIHGEA